MTTPADRQTASAAAAAGDVSAMPATAAKKKMTKENVRGKVEASVALPVAAAQVV